MTDQPYTPSKHLVGYAYVRTNAIKAPEHELWDEYHGFIAAIEAAAEQRGAERGWDQGYAAGVHDYVAAISDPTDHGTANPHRADQIGAQDA